MARPNPIRVIMEAELPSITYQRRKLFRPRPADITYAYNLLNRHVFRNKLKKPTIITGQLRKTWGTCQWNHTEQSGSYCELRLVDKWFCPQWFMNTLAHEMVHQWQWDIYRWEHQDYYGRDIYQESGAHGPSFFMWREEFAYYGLNLKTAFGQKRWFKFQNFNKC